MDYSKAKELRQKRAELIEQAGEILAREEEEDRSLTADEVERWNKLHDEADELKEKIERAERQEEREAGLSEVGEPRAGRPPVDPEEATTEGRSGEKEEDLEERAFWNFVRYGMSALPEEQRKVMESRQTHLDASGEVNIPEEIRALAAGTGSAGGFSVPEGVMQDIVSAEKAFGGMRQTRAEVITTSDGRDIPIPQDDDTSNKGAILSENTQISEQDITFSSTTLSAFMYTSKLVRVSLQLLQDAAFDLQSWLPDKLGTRIGRITNEHFTTGTGSSQPNGVVTASTKGADAQNAASLAYDDFVTLQHAVDPAYQRNGEWMLSNAGIREAKLILDGDGRPIWQQGMSVGEPDRILGDPFIVNQDVADPASAAKSVLYGDFNPYHIRDVEDVQLMVLRERYADFLQVGFFAFVRRDGDLIDAGTNPVQHLLHP